MYDETTKAKIATSKDYYYILGVRPDATSEEIEEAYQELYEKFGPHVNITGHDPDILIKTFNEISDAYEILMDPAKRREYDRASMGKRQSTAELRALLARRGAPPPPAPAPQPAGGNAGTHAQPGPETPSAPKIQAVAMEWEIEVTLKEAMKGTQREVMITDPKPCVGCQGQRSSGKNQCATCGGLGYIKIERKEMISVPGGMYPDQEIVFAGMGRYDLRAGRNGDLILRVRLKPHHCLSLLGRDITCTVPVTIYEAVLGAEIQAPCATGKVMIKIQPLTQPGRVYRLKGMGLAGADQLVTIEVVMPQVISGEEVALFRKLRDLSKEPNPRDNMFRNP